MDNYRKLLASKIHRAIVTHADVDYEGSITLPPELIKAANLIPYEAVRIWDVTSAARLETYVIEGMPGSRDISINGAAAHLIKRGNIVIIARFIYVAENDCHNFKPTVVFVDQNNRITAIRSEIAGPLSSPETATPRPIF